MSDNEKQQSIEERLNELEFLVGVSNLLDTGQILREIRVAALAIMTSIFRASPARYVDPGLEAEETLQEARERYDDKNEEEDEPSE